MTQLLSQLERFSITFGEPQFLYVLALLPLAALLIAWAARRRAAAIGRLGDPELINRLSQHVNWRGRRLHTRLWLLVLGMIVIALARPQWGSEVQVMEREGVQAMVVLDVSRSMLAEDIKPNRLSRAKLEIAELMERLDGDEIGLVLFSGASFIQFPLTFDYATARTFLENANPDLISRQGTAIAEAIDTALAGFNMEREGQKVIIIFTDGEDHEGDTLLATQQAVQEGVVIYAIGFGSPQGSPIPDYNAEGEVVGYKTDQDGAVVMSRLDEQSLQQIALRSGGRYYQASAGGAVEALTGELDNLEQGRIEGEVEAQRVERFHWFLLAAVAVLAVMELIPDRVAARASIGESASEAT